MTVLTLPIRGHITNSKLVRQYTKIIYVRSIITIIRQCVCLYTYAGAQCNYL